jgi:hypothetical protein
MMILSFHSDIVILETDTLHEQHPNAGAEITVMSVSSTEVLVSSMLNEYGGVGDTSPLIFLWSWGNTRRIV